MCNFVNFLSILLFFHGDDDVKIERKEKSIVINILEMVCSIVCPMLTGNDATAKKGLMFVYVFDGGHEIWSNAPLKKKTTNRIRCSNNGAQIYNTLEIMLKIWYFAVLFTIGCSLCAICNLKFNGKLKQFTCRPKFSILFCWWQPLFSSDKQISRIRITNDDRWIKTLMKFSV